MLAKWSLIANQLAGKSARQVEQEAVTGFRIVGRIEHVAQVAHPQHALPFTQVNGIQNAVNAVGHPMGVQHMCVP